MAGSAVEPSRPSEAPISTLNNVDEQWLDTHLKRVRSLIAEEAKRIEKDRGAEAPEGLDAAEGTRRFAPGVKFPAAPSLCQKTTASLSAITVVSAVLAVVFAFLRVFVSRGQLASAGTTAGYFDIAKLFAGAIVGSTRASVVLSARQK